MKGAYLQVQLYVSEEYEKIIGDDVATFLDEVKRDAIREAKRNLGLLDGMK